jgi:iron(III) transport system permease protein
MGVWLLAGYAIRFMALAHDTLVPTMASMNPRVSDAARSLGATPWRRFWRVEVPQFSSGLWAAWTLVFVAISKELPLTLLLAPLGHHTLAYRLYDAQQEGALANVGLAGLTLVTVSLLVVGITQGRQHRGGRDV